MGPGTSTGDPDSDPLSNLLTQLRDGPEDDSLVHRVVTAIEAADPDVRTGLVEQATTTLATAAPSLADLGNALWRRSFPDCELLGTRVLVAALRADPDTSDAVNGIASAIGYIHPPRDGPTPADGGLGSLMDEALELTRGHPRLLSAWGSWLTTHDHADRASELARRAGVGVLQWLHESPADTSLVAAVVDVVVKAIEAADPDDRTELVEQATATVSTASATLADLGNALWRRSFPDCELLGTRVLVAALRADPDNTDAVNGIASAIGFINPVDDGPEPGDGRLGSLVDEALDLTRQHPRLLSAWGTWLTDHGQAGRAAELGRRAAVTLLQRLHENPADGSPVHGFVSAIEAADPDDRTELVEQATTALATAAPTLVDLGNALSGRSLAAGELLSIRVLVAALRADPASTDAVAGIATALDLIDQPDDGADPGAGGLEPLIVEALDLSLGHPRLLSAWGTWLTAHGHAERGAVLIRQAPAGALQRLHENPADTSLVDVLVSAIEATDPDDRSELIEQATATLTTATATPTLIALGDALWPSSFTDCELLAARVFVAALRADPDNTDAIAGIASALTYINAPDGGLVPLIEEALELTRHDPRLLSAWGMWLRQNGHGERGAALARRACAVIMERLHENPADTSLVDGLVAALEAADPDHRGELVEQSTATLATSASTLAALGNALWTRSFADCELLGARVLVAALRADPANADTIGGIASALNYIHRPDDGLVPLIGEALELTRHDPRLTSAWTAWLARMQPVLIVPRRSDYGRCTCSGTFERRTVDVRAEVDGASVELSDVPQGACPSCDSRVYKANVLRVIETVVRGQPVPRTS